MKQCQQCGKVKEYNQFSKRVASKDGLQGKCKECNKKDNFDFRTQKPEHHAQWQKNNVKQHSQNVKRWYHNNAAADNSRSSIYFITAPDDFVYVGMCQTRFNRRIAAHKKMFKLNKGKLPLLHTSFSKWGWKKHKWKVIDLSGIDREMLKIIESNIIKINKAKGISLNVLD